MKAWTLEQLAFANDNCKPADFEKLWAKHTENADQARAFRMSLEEAGTLMDWVFLQFRGGMFWDLDHVETVDLVIDEIVGSYGT